MVSIDMVWNEEDKTFWCTVFDEDERYYLVLDDRGYERTMNVCFMPSRDTLNLTAHVPLPKNWETVR